MSKPTLKALLVLLLATVLFYWKILLTSQFSLLTEAEGVNQAYSWFHFWITSIRQGVLPLWDPYTFSGHSFIGEMQTAAFYPLHLLLALVPFNRNGVFSPQLYHLWFAFAHFLGGCFMFALVRELGLRRFSALIAGVCFSLSGFVARAEWPHMFESAIWLPLVFLFLLRALRAEKMKQALRNASLSGLSLGLAVLAGGLHIVVMQALVVVSSAAFTGFHPQLQAEGVRGRAWARPALVTAVVAVVSFCAGAIQLLPSMEYGGHALRFLGSAGALPATTKIPYAYISDGLWPHAFVGLLISFAFSGNLGAGEVISPYAGVFPLIAAIIGIRNRWSNPWVRYLAGLAAVAFLYSLGSFSLLHGVLYALVPRLWMTWEAGRFMYLAGFSLAILAAFGVETLLCEPAERLAWRGLNRILIGAVIAGAIALAVPALFGRPEINPWVSLSILLIFASYGLFRHILHGHAGPMTRLVMVALILFDLSAFDWGPRNKIQAVRTGTNHLDRLLSCRAAADFLKSRPGPFRVQILADPQPSIGDVFMVPTLSGRGTTLMLDYASFMGHTDLLNARYILRPASAGEPGPLYQDAAWKVYENPKAYPRAWIVHETLIEPFPEQLLRRLDTPEVDPHRQALLSIPLHVAPEPVVEGAREEVTFQAYGANSLELTVLAQSRGLLVLSEIFYPGWRATVNGKAERIYKVDGALRGIVVPQGESHVTLRYAPWSVFAGALLSLAAFCGTLALSWGRWSEKRA